MAQFAKNSNYFGGARSKTTFSSQENGNNKSKKGKKKGSESGFKGTNAWSKGQNQDYSRQDSAPDRRREPRTLWNDIEHEFPACDTAPAVPSVWEQKQRKSDQPNVWQQRSQKFQENKALEPRDEDEEEKMIRLALELSKRETESDDIRRRLEEEYRLQEQMLMNNPDQFKEFQFEEPSDAFSVKNVPSKESYAESEEWDDGKYAMALKSNPTKKFTSTSNTKSYNNWDNSNDEIKQNKLSANYKPIDNWEGYSTKVNVSPNKTVSGSDTWDDIEYGTQNNSSAHKINDACKGESYDNWGDYDDVKQSSSNCTTNDCWDDYEKPQTNKNEKVSKGSSRQHSSDNWDDIKSSNYEDYDLKENTVKWDSNENTQSKPLKQKENYSKPIEKEICRSVNNNKTESTKSNVRKVVDMFGGWGSTATENAARKGASTTVVENSAKNIGNSLNKTKSTGLKHEFDELENLSVSVQKTHLQSEDISSLKKDSKPYKEVENLELERNGKSAAARVPEVDTSFQSIKDKTHPNNTQTFNTIHSMNHNSVINEATVSVETKQSECAVSSTESKIKSESALLNKIPLVDSILSSSATTSISQTSGFSIGDNSTNSRDPSNESMVSNLPAASKISTNPNPDDCLEGYSNVTSSDAIPNIRPLASNEHYNKVSTFLPDEAPKQVPTFQSNECTDSPKSTATFQFNECINPPMQVPNFQSNDCINAPKQADSFQSLNPNLNTEGPNVSPSIPAPTFSTPEFMNAFPSPASQLGGECMNPNLIGGVNPLLMQYMQMISNPFLAAQWQACEMYYRAMGMPIGPVIFSQVPMMPNLRNPAVGDPTSFPFGNSHNNVNIQSSGFGEPVINAPVNPANEILNLHEQYNANNVSSAVSFPSTPSDMPLKLDDETESLLRSFLSPKEESSNDSEVFIKPPVMVADNTMGSACGPSSSVETVPSFNNQSNADENYTNNSSECTNSSVFQATIQPSECIGWGDQDSNTSSKSNYNTWDDEIDGWGDENSTTKSMGNPSLYNSAKSANRQPSRQPNFRRNRN